MNNIQKLKFSLYKKQILNEFSNYNILDVYYGEELSQYIEFNKKISLLDSIKRERICYYNSDIHKYIDINIVYPDAFIYFQDKLNIFEKKDIVIYFIWYKGEYFGLKVFFSEELVLINQKLNNKEFLIIQDNFNKLVSLDILEYDIEIISFNSEK